MSKTKVIPRQPSPWRLAVLLVVGMLSIGGNFSGARWFVYNVGAAGPEIHVGLIVTFFLLIPGLLVALSFSEQRVLVAVFEAIAVWLGVVIAVYLSSALTSAVIRVAALAWVVLAAYLVAIRLAGLAVVRMFVVTVVVQDGTLCGACGYDLTGNVSGVCPECGTEIEAAAKLDAH